MTVTSQTPASGQARQFLAGGFLLLALVVAMAVIFTARQRASDANARAILTATDQLSNVLSTARLADSGQRGYLLTGQASYLGPYYIALHNMPGELQALDASLAKGPEAGNLAIIHAIIKSKFSMLAQTVSLYQSGSQDAAIAIVRNDSGMTDMTNLRNLIGAMKARLAQQLAVTEAEDNRNGWILQIATTIAVIATALLGTFAIRDTRLLNNRLLAAETALIGVNRALERKVEERTRTLRTSEAQFRTLAESIPSFVFITDADLKNTYVNPQFLAYTGSPAPEMLAEKWHAFVHPEDLPAVLAAAQTAAQSGRPYQVEYRLRRYDGACRWFLTQSATMRNEAGEITGWIGICTDIDDRKHAETAMIDANVQLERRVSERSRELDRIFRLSTDILATVDFSGTYKNVSPAWEKILGRPVSEALAHNYIDFVHPDHIGKVKTDLQQLRQGQSVFDENRYRRADGSYCWLSWRAVSLPEEQLIYAVARDVTAEKEREEQLRQSQKMEVVGQLTGGIAHDFNNLLTIIMGSLELLQRGLSTADTKIIRRVEAAMDGAKRAAALTHRLLAFARRQPLEPKPIEPDRLVGGMADMLTRLLGENIALEFVNAAGLWKIQADINQLENSILNLAVNARDAMPEGGHLTIETQNTYLDESYAATNTDVAPGQYVMIAVTDTGCGMSPAIRKKIFEPFFTTKPQGQGTGLGLAQVYGFIKQSNGHISIYSEPAQGTSVKLYLPRLSKTELNEEAARPPQIAGTASQGETILVVEDEENVRNFSVEVLEDFGYHVLAAENAAAALKLLAAAPEIHMLFTDVVLTGTVNGRQLADEVKRLRPGIAVLYTTGYTRNAIVHHGRLDDGIDFIGKPFTAAALSQMVRKILDRAAASKPSTA